MKATPQEWDLEGWVPLADPTHPPDGTELARCRYCKKLISFPDAIDRNGKHYPVFDRKVWRDDDGFWHEGCAPNGKPVAA